MTPILLYIVCGTAPSHPHPQVINTLGMSRDEMADMWETFDAELLDLSRLDTPHVVKVDTHATRR